MTADTTVEGATHTAGTPCPGTGARRRGTGQPVHRGVADDPPGRHRRDTDCPASLRVLTGAARMRHCVREGSWSVPVGSSCWLGAAPCRWRAYVGLPGGVFGQTSREGRVAHGGAVLTVGANPVEVEAGLMSGALACPGCAGSLGPWGWARTRSLRGAVGPVVVRPRRARCSSCRVSHVLLPVFALLRRADLVEVIGAALAAKAVGCGARTIAAGLARPVETVRDWLRTFAARAEALRAWFTVLLVDTGVDPVPPAAARTPFADAVAAVLGAVVAARSRWPRVGVVSPWWWASAASAGRLLAPGWPGAGRNTSSP